MSNALSEFLNGIKTITIAGKPMEIKAEIGDKQKIMAIMSNSKKDKVTEDSVKELHDAFKTILRRSFPNEQNIEQKLDEFLLRYDMDFQTELSIFYGWMTRKQVEELKKNIFFNQATLAQQLVLK